VSDEPDNPAMEEAMALVKRTLAEQIDFLLVARIEELEGKVPSREAMHRHVGRLIKVATGESHYFYKRRCILVVTPPTTANGKFILRPV